MALNEIYLAFMALPVKKVPDPWVMVNILTALCSEIFVWWEEHRLFVVVVLGAIVFLRMLVLLRPKLKWNLYPCALPLQGVTPAYSGGEMAHWT